MISIALCTYNGERFIEQQLNSIIEQTQAPDEIVICDDHSNDNTVLIVKTVLKKWCGLVTIVVNDKNLGYKKNYEKAISLCSGDIIFLCDQDDVWDITKIREVSQIYINNPSVSMVFHDAIVADENLQEIYPSFWKLLGVNYHDIENYDYNIFLEKNIIQGSACSFRKTVFNDAFPFPSMANHDEWLGLNAILKGKLIPLGKPLMRYRQSDNNALGIGDVRIKDKLTHWVTDINKKAITHISELRRRKDVFLAYETVYIRLVACNVFKNITLREFREFLELRINYIENSNILTLIDLISSYIQNYDNLNHVSKNLLKDIIVGFILNKKVKHR